MEEKEALLTVIAFQTRRAEMTRMPSVAHGVRELTMRDRERGEGREGGKERGEEGDGGGGGGREWRKSVAVKRNGAERAHAHHRTTPSAAPSHSEPLLNSSFPPPSSSHSSSVSSINQSSSPLRSDDIALRTLSELDSDTTSSLSSSPSFSSSPSDTSIPSTTIPVKPPRGSRIQKRTHSVEVSGDRKIRDGNEGEGSAAVVGEED